MTLRGKLVVANIGQILIEFGNSNTQTVDEVAARIEAFMAREYTDEAFCKFIAEQVKSIALLAEDNPQ